MADNDVLNAQLKALYSGVVPAAIGSFIVSIVVYTILIDYAIYHQLAIFGLVCVLFSYTLRAGDGLCDEEVVRTVISEGPKCGHTSWRPAQNLL